jgi:L-iditol 2-dehydrogenase
VPVPRLEDEGDVLIRVKDCGICGSDLAILEGRHPSKPPVVLGHELSGEVERVGRKVSALRVGDHVVVDPNLNCGLCRNCRVGRRNMCENLLELGISRDGGFAEFVATPGSSVYKIDPGLPWNEGALVEPLACVVHGIEKSRVRPEETVVVFGAGPMGLLWVSMLRRMGVRRIISVDLAERRRRAAERLGADATIDPVQEETVAKVMQETGGAGADVAVEVVGRTETVENAVNSVGAGGRVVIMGVSQRETLARVAPFGVMSKELEILGSNANSTGFVPAISLIEGRVVPVDQIVSHELGLKDAEKGFDLCKSGEALKVLIRAG